MLGSHVGLGGKEQFLGSVKEALSYNAETFMVYTGAPQNTRRKDLSEMRIPEANALMAEKGITKFVVHAPYIVNLGNTVKPDAFDFAVEFLREELRRTAEMGSDTMVLHPGAHVGEGEDAGIQSIIKGINLILNADTKAHIALETMAGKYFPLNQIACIHLNDSKNEQGSHKDRHENIGFGTIGFDRLCAITKMTEFADTPIILETPYVPKEGEKERAFSPYRQEIAMLRSGVFNPELIELIRKEAET